jgi:hypothetical protein
MINHSFPNYLGILSSTRLDSQGPPTFFCFSDFHLIMEFAGPLSESHLRLGTRGDRAGAVGRTGENRLVGPLSLASSRRVSRALMSVSCCGMSLGRSWRGVMGCYTCSLSFFFSFKYFISILFNSFQTFDTEGGLC